MTDPDPGLLAKVPLDAEWAGGVRRRARSILARPRTPRDLAEGVTVTLFSFATLAWALLAVVRIG